MEKYAGNLPKAKVRKTARKPATIAQVADRQRVAAQVTKARRTTVKADTRDILKVAPAADVRRITPTVTVKPRGAKHPVIVDTGNIIQGQTVPARPKAVKRPSFGQALKQELEGKGALADALGKAAPTIAKVIAPDPQKVTFNVNGHKVVTHPAAAGIAGVKTGKFAQRFAKDIVNFPAVAVPSVYVPAAAVAEAARGDTSRGKKLLHDLPHTDPVAALVTGHPRRALKIANEHPGFATIEAFGVKGAVGRAAGGAMRLTPRGSKAHAIASTRRADRVLPGTTLREKQSYSPDLGRKAVQVLDERRLARRAAQVRRKAAATQDPELLANAHKLDPTQISDAELRRRVDERVAANETVRRHNRTVAMEEAHRAITGTATPTGGPLRRVRTVAANRRVGVKPTAATTLRAQAITDATPRDLAAYRDELAAQHDQLGPSQQLANRTLRKQIDKAIKSGPDPIALRDAADRYTQVMAPRQAALVGHGILSSEQVAKAPLVPYAVRHMQGVKAGEHGPVHADGTPVTPAEIEAHMHRSGVKEPVYVTQAPGQRGAKNFYVSSGQPPRVSSGTRTGSATIKGTLDAHPDVLIEGAARAQGLVDAADGFTNTIGEFAHKPTLGHLKTRKDADQAARDLQASTGTAWRPVRIHPFGADNKQLRALLDKAGEGDIGENVGAAQPIRDAMEAALKGQGDGPWALLPEAAAAQLQAHLHNLGAGPKAKALQVLGSGFRRTVLSTSPTWMTGNVTEAAMRTGLAKVGPRSYVTGRRAVKRLQEIDPNAAQALTARATGGGHFSMADRQHIRRDSTQFQGSTVLEPTARALGAFWRAPGPKQVAGAWHAWTDLVFRQLNGRLESQFQTAMLGKALRDSPLMDGQVRKLSAQAIDQAAHGLRDTNEQVRFARAVERMYGKYSAFSPDTRWAIATYTPFIAWTINAIEFLYGWPGRGLGVLPRDHPTATALIAAAENATTEWRKDHGLDLFMKGALPGFLQGSIPLSGGRHQRAPFRYTPFGAFGDIGETAAGAVLPQFTGVLSAFKGEDWKGAKLRNPDGSPADLGTKALAAAGSFIDSTVPIVAQASRIGDKGIGALNPIAPIAARKAKVRKASPGPARTAEQDIDALLNSSPAQQDIDRLLNQIP